MSSENTDNMDYMTHYKRLEEAANSLSNLSAPDVDKIMPLVNQGMESYRAVKARIEAVRKAVGELGDG